MDLGLKGKRALVTGGTRGIGRAIAERLVAEGADVALCARKRNEVDAAVAALQAKGARVFGSTLDVADAAALARFVADAGQALGGLDIVVANASALATGSDAAAFRQAFDVDLMHTVNAAHAALPFLERSASGAFVAIASISGTEDYGYGEVAYGTMKAALLYYVKCLANHWARKGIRANLVSPGTTYFEGGVWHEIERNDPAGFADAMARNPLGRMARPEDIANAVAFVASPAAGFVTGDNFVVDGGFTHRIQN